MIIVKLMGGLGNQMFQYAAAKALSLRLNAPLKVDLSFLLDRSYQADFTYRDYELSYFKIEPEFISKESLSSFLRWSKKFETVRLSAVNRRLFNYKLPIPKTFYEATSKYSADFSLLSKNTYLVGYWQSDKYFKGSEKEIRECFRLKNENLKYESLQTFGAEQESVSVHVRRGDYANNPHINNVHGLCGIDYYKRALEMMAAKLDRPTFYFFSDDLPWVVDNLGFLSEKFSVHYMEPGKSAQTDLYIMSQCKHNIIANSSFSWWAAWLNRHSEKIVVAPKKWFADSSIDTCDLIPNGWTRL